MLIPKLDEQGKEVLDGEGKVIMVEDGNPPDVPKTHSHDAFKAVTNDMHKYKKERNDSQLKIEQLQKKIDDIAKDQLIAKEEYKELYETEVKKNMELENQLKEKNDKFINVHKKQKVIEKLGGFRKPEYNKFIDITKIIMDDNGDVDEMTVDVEVKRLKQEYPELIKKSKGSTLPNNAPESGDAIGSKTLKEMSKEERSQHRRSLIEKRVIEENTN